MSSLINAILKDRFSKLRPCGTHGSSMLTWILCDCQANKQIVPVVNNTQAPEARPQPTPHHSEDSASIKRKEKGFRNPLARSKSIRRDSNSKSKPSGKQSFDQPPKTAPLTSDWANSNDMVMFKKNKDRRGKSAERAIVSESEDNLLQESTLR